MIEKTAVIQNNGLLRKMKGSVLGKFLKALLFPYRRVRFLHNQLRKNTSILSGEAGGERLSIFYAGTSANKACIAQAVFGNEFSEKNLGMAYTWMVPLMISKRRRRGECQLSIVETGRKKSGKSPGKSFFVPCWTGGYVDASDQTRQALKSIRWDMQKIKRFGLSPEISTDPALYEFFYNKMYLPFIRIKHGKGTVTARWDEVEAIMGQSELIFIKWKDQYIGGAILIYLKDFGHLWINGVIDGNREYMKLGIVGAIDHFAEKRVLEKGYRKMHYGASRPFLKDGVLNYKRNRGLVLSDFIKIYFLVTPLDNSRSTKNFFLENPFLYLEEGKLAGAVFSNSRGLDQNSLSAIHDEYFIKGMRKLNIFVLDGGKFPEVPPQLSKEIGVLKLDLF